MSQKAEIENDNSNNDNKSEIKSSSTNDDSFYIRSLENIYQIFLKSIEIDTVTDSENDDDEASKDRKSNSNSIDKEKDKDETLAMTNYELEQLMNMLKIPVHIEKYMLFTLLGSIDGFLYYFTVLPIKIIHGILRNNQKKTTNWMLRTYKERYTLFLILFSTIILSKLDTSKIYHRIKRQNTMKLYMLFNVLEMGDTMLASLGQSLFKILWSPIIRGYRNDRCKQIILVTLTLTYLVLHGYILIFQAISLNVAVNSYSNSLLALLLSMQFAELKSSVYKKFDKEGLFQITISDLVQRFKIFLLLLIIILRNLGSMIGDEPISFVGIFWRVMNLSKPSMKKINSVTSWSPMVSVFTSEIVVDWIKHAYIIKFNRIKPEVYDKFYYIMCRDQLANMNQFQERLGLILPAYVILFLVMSGPVIWKVTKGRVLRSVIVDDSLAIMLLQATITTIIILVSLTLFRTITHTLLYRWGEYIASHKDGSTVAVGEKDYVKGTLSEGRGQMDDITRSIIYEPIPPSLNERRIARDHKNAHSLEGVTRYKMVSKRIW